MPPEFHLPPARRLPSPACLTFAPTFAAACAQRCFASTRLRNVCSLSPRRACSPRALITISRAMTAPHCYQPRRFYCRRLRADARRAMSPRRLLPRHCRVRRRWLLRKFSLLMLSAAVSAPDVVYRFFTRDFVKMLSMLYRPPRRFGALSHVSRDLLLDMRLKGRCSVSAHAKVALFTSLITTFSPDHRAAITCNARCRSCVIGRVSYHFCATPDASRFFPPRRVSRRYARLTRLPASLTPKFSPPLLPPACLRGAVAADAARRR